MGASGSILTPGMHVKVSVSRLPHRVNTQSGFVCLFNWFLTILLRIIYFIYSNAAAVMQFLPVTWNPYFRKSQHNNHNNSSAFTWLIHSRLFRLLFTKVGVSRSATVFTHDWTAYFFWKLCIYWNIDLLICRWLLLLFLEMLRHSRCLTCLQVCKAD